MASSLTWLDHDSAARDRSLRVLSLFREKESRDELGIGSIRDGIADILFPGTSTIQTRLRYMLLVPWMYRELESRRLAPGSFSLESRRFELSMVEPLLDKNERGVFGAQSKGDLKRLPSSVYWAGLRTWGIRAFDGSQSDYFRSAPALALKRTARRRKDDDDADPNASLTTWHLGLPAAPEGFPTKLSLKISPDEARYLRDRIATSCPESLLSWLVLRGRPDDCREPWLHHQLGSFPKPTRDLLEHGRLLSDVVEGAAWLYNVCLADKRQDEALGQSHREGLEEWRGRASLSDIEKWDLGDLWNVLASRGHPISSTTRGFVADWTARLIATRGEFAEDDSARDLIERRERTLKKSRSRFTNRGALNQWGGSSGLNRLVYRWPTTNDFLRDLLPALRRS
ncbi:hypothetical protein EV673_0395 [Limnobacter thiooxidans]|uniref:DUF6361 family protein n=1 Tax=Limnobacter thiooxidans TaxID=131080 RepID=A0AA86J7L4_9BURK|nr:hypothetical protein EV673_0395 [Limnobacter thiooxidans]BET26495.1 DUF6361 family protein [Limnobacter thiooxidans]